MKDNQRDIWHASTGLWPTFLMMYDSESDVIGAVGSITSCGHHGWIFWGGGGPLSRPATNSAPQQSQWKVDRSLKQVWTRANDDRWAKFRESGHVWPQYFGRGTLTCPGLWRHDITVLRVAMAINTKIINNTLLIPLCFWFAVNLDLREKKKESLFPCHMVLLREIYLATADLSRTNHFSCKAIRFPDYLDREHFSH